MYAEIGKAYIDDPVERKEIFEAIETMPTIKRKSQWAQRWLESSTATFAERLVAFAIVEGLFFSASFASIFYYKPKGQLPGLIAANELISRDEGLHCDFACRLYTAHLKKKLSYERVRMMIEEAVEIEAEFVRESLPDAFIGMNSALMIQYVHFVANQLLV